MYRISGSGEGGATIQLFEPSSTDCVTRLVSRHLGLLALY
ncbi:hypothetical protein PD5205_01566 [Xanthomonas fragariae]|uniref:Uncharacterized protein n=1 Tax=Xanthomonas fragariae TaxID=48664 RepID=A0A1Y6GVN1_9XANT|nr:hypothetical protein NBC2815_01602 [Xanthomonas fragariae]SMQ98840.1 hypothetical protein PD885_01592 [Xanthomonas fragariae]SMR02873.1 hypothetical protein PD5205_01566 [Xanthomonas fragariae]